MESPPGLKDYSDVKLPTNTLDILTHPSHIGITTSGPLSSSCPSSGVLVSAVFCVGGAEALRMKFGG